MKIRLILALVLLSSCHKKGTSFNCKCSNGKSFHMQDEHNLAQGYCDMRQKEFNDTAKTLVTCTLK